MSWLFSQALVGEYLAANSLDGEPSVQLNGKPTQQVYCAPDKMTEFSRLSRFGMTFKPLTDILGEILLMLYLEDFHAKTSQPQEKAQELMENEAECGDKWRGSFVKYDPDSSLWKTHQCSLLGDLDEFLETWPQWGLMRNGECWEQKTLEQTIRGTEFGLLPNGVDSFHTPNTTGLDGGSNSRKALKKRQETWPTPTVMDSINHFETLEVWMERNKKNKQKNPNLGETQKSLRSVVHWPTPVCQDSRHATTRHLDPKNQHWKSNLGKVVMSMEKPNIGGRLNPTWVEWLMGWPQEWTDLKPLETGKSHCAPQQHGES
jgi:DNA (cytosine-5)-methyltransferase 1